MFVTVVRAIKLAIFSVVMLPGLGQADDITIFDARKPVALSNDQSVFKDYYLNGGLQAGLKPGMIITVKRRVALYDSYKNQSPGELLIPVGKVKVLYVQADVAVAREHSNMGRKDHPILIDDFIMIGDKLDLSTARMESKSKKRRSQDSSSRSQRPDKSKRRADARAVDFTIDFASEAPEGEVPAPPAEVPLLQ